MAIIEPDQLLLLAAATTAITLLLSAFVVVHTRKIHDQLLELHALKHSVRRLDSNVGDVEQFVDSVSEGLTGPPSTELHFRQVKRDQVQVSEKLSAIATAMDTFEGLLQLRHHLEKQNREIAELAEASRGLQEWKSRVSAVCSEAGHLFESEPSRELIEGFDR